MKLVRILGLVAVLSVVTLGVFKGSALAGQPQCPEKGCSVVIHP